MKPLSVELQNFASYSALTFDFQNQGLCLIQGPTGAGKSTLCDAIPWILFGRTAKGGTVDEIRSWSSTEPTTGKLLLSLSDGEWEVVRVRGKTNDLYFRRTGDESLSRGRDLADSQRLLNDKLGMDFELYLASAYYHEFSQTAQFFTATAKNRRLICEQIVDLSLAVKLQERLRDENKELSKQILAVESDLRVDKSTLQLLKTKEEKERTRSVDWESERQRRLLRCGQEYEAFEKSRKRIISRTCKTCGTTLEKPREVIDDSLNPHFCRLNDIEAERNPYEGEVKSYKEEIQATLDQIRSAETRLELFRRQTLDLDSLGVVTSLYRSQTITRTIQFLEAQTNEYLTNFFDSEIQVQFEVASADKLDVTIRKDGNIASFTQLSKGQRCLLKLCFGVSVMTAVQNHHGISIDKIFLDEALDGLDDSMKRRALTMLMTISFSYDSIFLVEHSEALKAQIDNKFSVELVNGESQIAKAQ